MQDILDTRDNLRAQVESLDGGYATIAKILKRSDVAVLKALSADNVPRLTTLENIKEAVETAKRTQKARLEALNA